MTRSWLVVIDAQTVFADPASPWAAPRFAEVHPSIRELTRAFAGRTVFTRFVAPAEPVGAWVDYYTQWPFALQPPDAPLYKLVDDPGGAPVMTATTFGKWTPELTGLVGAGPLVLAGVATECCVLTTALAAADAGVAVQVVTDACAGGTDADHQRALDVLGLYAPLITLHSTAEIVAGLDPDPIPGPAPRPRRRSALIPPRDAGPEGISQAGPTRTRQTNVTGD